MTGTEHRKTILKQIEDCVCRDRQNTYSDAEDNFADIAHLWNFWMYARYGADVKLDSKDVAMMSAMIKVARAAVNPNYLDNWVDLGGYAVCGGGIARREKGVAPAGTAGIQVPSTAQPDYTKEPNA